MKITIKSIFHYCLLVSLIIISIISCKKKKEDVNDPIPNVENSSGDITPTISDVSVNTDSSGVVIDINGLNLDKVKNVMLNGVEVGSFSISNTTNLKLNFKTADSSYYFGTITLKSATYSYSVFFGNYIGKPVSFTVPNGVHSIKIIANGAGGASTNGHFGGAGAQLTGFLPVNAGDIYSMIVGGEGEIGSYPSAGAGGGGFTGLLQGLKPIFIAGGGGGAAGSLCISCDGGNGGIPFVNCPTGAVSNGCNDSICKINGELGNVGVFYSSVTESVGNGGNGGFGGGGGGAGYTHNSSYSPSRPWIGWDEKSGGGGGVGGGFKGGCGISSGRYYTPSYGDVSFVQGTGGLGGSSYSGTAKNVSNNIGAGASAGKNGSILISW